MVERGTVSRVVRELCCGAEGLRTESHSGNPALRGYLTMVGEGLSVIGHCLSYAVARNTKIHITQTRPCNIQQYFTAVKCYFSDENFQYFPFFAIKH